MAELRVRDGMTESYVELSPTTASSKAAQIMADSDADCILVIKEKKPLGIVTASDFLRRIVAEGRDASEISIKDITSSPVITVDMNETLAEASMKLSYNDVKRLVVVDKEEVVGILTSIDLLSYAEEIGEAEEEREVGPRMCESCGEYVNNLTEVNGRFVCEDCKELMEG